MDMIPDLSKVTVVIPTFRRPEMLQRAIQSVLAQSASQFCILVCNNASGDETEKVVAKIARAEKRLFYHCHSKNIGPIQNFNFGMKQVQTPFFSLLSDDSILLPNFLAEGLAILDSFPQAAFFAGQSEIVNVHGKKLGHSLRGWDDGLIAPPEGLLQIIEKRVPSWESVLFRSSVLKDFGYLNPRFDGAADQDFMTRIAQKCHFYVQKKPHAVILHHKDSWSSSRKLAELIASRKGILGRLLVEKELPKNIRKRIAASQRRYIKKAITNYVYKKCMIEADSEALVLARSLMMQELGFSPKPYLMVVLAGLVLRFRFVKKAALAPMHLYIHLRRRVS